MKKVYSFTIILLILLGCDGMDNFDTIWVENASGHDIALYFGEGYKGEPVYPDTTLPKNSNSIIHASRIFYPNDSRTPWEEVYKRFPKDTMCLFVLHPDTLAKYTWEEVKTGYKILKRYDLSWEDWLKHDRTITYPPTKAMKNIKQYPPYE